MRGFSLLEVVVAFAITTLALGVLFQIFSRALYTGTVGERYSRAAALAEAKLAAIGMEMPLAPGVYAGTAEDGMEWSVTIAPYTPSGWVGEASPVALYAVTAVAVWPDAGPGRQVSLTSLRLGPLP